VTTRSGDLILLDFGLLPLWSGDKPPVMPPGQLDPERKAKADASQDLEIVGKDARAVADLVNLASVRGRYAFDQPDGGALVEERVSSIVEREGLKATVKRVDRMPHLERARRLLDEDPDGVEVQFHGPWGVATRGLPSERELRVLGTRMDPAGPDAGKWQSVWVEVTPSPPARSSEIGYVLVDEARLMFADPVALTDWQHDESRDGLADVAFWGRDAQLVAHELGAGTVTGVGEPFGWADLSIAAAQLRCKELVQRKAEPGTAFALDYRPHDDAYRLLVQAWTSPTESGTVDVGGIRTTGFFTSWGDGAFPVFRDLDSSDKVCRIRVELGAPEIVTRQRRFDDLWTGELSKNAIVSATVARDGQRVRFIYREPPKRNDSGWRVFTGFESQEYLDEAENAVVMPLRELIARDKDLEPLFRIPGRVAFERDLEDRFVACPSPSIDT
jgi:hypothetical protein